MNLNICTRCHSFLFSGQNNKQGSAHQKFPKQTLKKPNKCMGRRFNFFCLILFIVDINKNIINDCYNALYNYKRFGFIKISYLTTSTSSKTKENFTSAIVVYHQCLWKFPRWNESSLIIFIIQLSTTAKGRSNAIPREYYKIYKQNINILCQICIKHFKVFVHMSQIQPIFFFKKYIYFQFVNWEIKINIFGWYDILKHLNLFF